MPAGRGFRHDDEERLFPLGPESAEGDPEKLVEDVEFRPRTSSLQHGELLPEHEILQHKTPMAVRETSERTDPEQQ